MTNLFPLADYKKQKKRPIEEKEYVPTVNVLIDSGTKLLFSQHFQHILNIYQENYDEENAIDYFPFSVNGDCYDAHTVSALNTKYNKLILHGDCWIL
jgi:hypothetical protein